MIEITRMPSYKDKARKYKIYIDEKCIDTIEENEIKKLILPKGKHKIIIKIDWCTSNEIEFEVTGSDNELIKFQCNDTLNIWKILFSLLYVTIFRKRYINLEIIR